ncbi:MAG TPA: hypothetical protein VF284_09470 [Rhodanobacteraceae bacterium]
MNMLLQTLRTPWIASPRSSRWLALVVVVLCGFSAAIAAHGLEGKAALAVPALVWSAGIGVWLWLVAINAIFMARDATKLRLPHARRAANASMLCYILLSVPLPALLFSLALGHALAWLVCFALAEAVALLFLLLPGWLVFVVIIGQSAVINMHIVHFKTPTPHQLALDLIAPTVAIAALAAWRWFALQRASFPMVLGFSKPVLWGLRLQSFKGTSLRDRNGDALLARSSRTWLAPVANLRGTGPDAPIRSLRVALGRDAMPKTAASFLKQWGYATAFFTVIVGAQLLAEGSNHDLRQIFAVLITPQRRGFVLPIIIAGVFALIPVLTTGLSLRSRWSSNAAELPLLAMLPGLGDPARARPRVVIACLTATLQMVAGEIVVLCALAAWTHVFFGALPFIVLSAACTLALPAASVLGTLGARPLGNWTLIALTLLLMLLCAVAMVAGFSRDGFNVHTWPALLGALILMLVVLGAFCLRGWRALARRPHPFLATA